MYKNHIAGRDGSGCAAIRAQHVQHGLIGYVAAGKGLSDAAYQHEGQAAIAHFLVALHVAHKLAGGKIPPRIADPQRHGQVFQMAGHALKVPGGAVAQPDRQHEGQPQPDGHGFPMQQAAIVPHLGFQRVAEGVAQVEQGAAIDAALLALIGRDHAGLEGTGHADGLGLHGGVARQHRRPVALTPCEQCRIAQQPGFYDFGIPRAQFAHRQGGQGGRIGQHGDGLVERAHQILAKRGIDARLAPHRRIHLRKQRGRNLYEWQPAQGGGGGVVGDLSGFCAATTLRGLPFVQIPTTLLSQVDSSVGGKTGINTPFGKNLVGAFHQPIAVLADTSTLATLPVRELRAGYAEIVKSGLLGDAALFAWCERHGAAVLAGDPAMQAEAIRMACAFKARVVTADEREERRVDGRALLNLGHTFGHALEAEMGYDGSLLHGEAVSIGLRLAFMLSVRLGYCPAGDLERVTRHLEDLSMPLRVSDTGRNFSASQLVRNMQRDKKMRDGRLSFVLVRGIGQAFTCRDVPDEAVLDVLRADGCTP